MKPKLTLRDLFWLTLVVGLVLGWWLDRQSDSSRHALELEKAARKSAFLIETLDRNGVLFKESPAGFLAYPKPEGVDAEYLPPGQYMGGK